MILISPWIEKRQKSYLMDGGKPGGRHHQPRRLYNYMREKKP
jgi:hypothetical protein